MGLLGRRNLLSTNILSLRDSPVRGEILVEYKTPPV